jgi:hypothetical protein
VTCAAVAVDAARNSAKTQGLELQFRLRYPCPVSSAATRRAYSPFEIAIRQCFNCSIFGEFESAQAADSMRSVLVRERAQRTRGTVVHQPQSVRSKLKTSAAALDAAQPPAFWASGSGLRAGPVSWPPCAHAGWLLPSRGSCARRVFHTPCGASSHEKRPRAAFSF